MAGFRLILPLLALGLAAPAGAETLADVRAELGQLAAAFNALKAELTTTGASARVGGADALARMDTIEAELMRLTSRTEEIELRLNRVVSDGTNRIGDIEFRLCEATPGCDPMNMSATPTLGGDSGGSSAAPVITPAAPSAGSSSSGPELAVAEQADFDRAKGVLGQGDFPGAASLFETYAQSYPGGPLIPEAHYLRGDALAKMGETARAARAYLDAYSSNPQGPIAPDAVLKLGEALGQLGQTEQACLTLAQVGIEYPGSIAATQAPIAMQGLGCR
ncbi:tol-pal system protein YbgF [Pseudogemmobacter humi]|uniref:Cell division coordinator CpoB n=1 Tax=Pseudogemmobacter humi TaxID=2483812 RepID=A0A3P5XEE9_9RHOB|nr:tol-pal system protein YbgF [Pseudogemmobacter humi]VDC33169.1 tol-pal system protein YbgF [Pseudogemmobacter humi]